MSVSSGAPGFISENQAHNKKMNRQLKTNKALIEAHILVASVLSIVPPCSVQEIWLVFGNV